MIERYDVDTKHGLLGISVEIVSTDKVDNYETLDFIITIHLPYDFREHDTRVKVKGGKTTIEMDTSYEITPDDFLTI